MVLGILGAVFCFIGIFVATVILDTISLVLSVVALIMAGKCFSSGERDGMAVTGLVTSIVAIVISFICLIIFLAAGALLFA